MNGKSNGKKLLNYGVCQDPTTSQLPGQEVAEVIIQHGEHNSYPPRYSLNMRWNNATVGSQSP
jgi:hypothetical protein